MSVDVREKKAVATPRRGRPWWKRPVALARKWWGQLTSMRTALILLFALAVGAIPGSILPQRTVNIENVNAYFAENPDLAPFLDRLWMFDVYAAPWFAAIYGLLFISLIGCLVPRLREHFDALRRRPPDAPARLDLMPEKASWTAEDDGETVARLRSVLRSRRYRTIVREHADGTVTLSAEKGYLRETGNLLFHFALLGLLVGVAFGALYGWHGNRILGEGADNAFCNNLQQYDDYGLGPNVTPADLPKFCIQLDDFEASYLDNGQPMMYSADLRYGEGGGAPDEAYHLEVNEPLRLADNNVYLLGHGYAPVIEFTDQHGNVQTSSTPFLPMDAATMLSEGVAMFPDANITPEGVRDKTKQVAFEGMFMPTVPDEAPYTRSLFPSANNPAVMLFAYVGDTGLDRGRPGSVYALDRQQVASGALNAEGQGFLLKLGESKQVAGGTVTFKALQQYATIQTRSDPGEGIVLWSSVALLAGLLPSLLVKRRRVWFRVNGNDVTAGGLPRTENQAFAVEFGELVAKAKES
ncbi:cytochrome c biogenesis protein ResB [Phytomonospora sp. NPDC050363]|uniref:cytochrome c biogenesis protein ResB n=1 Tax=Phytomonospora sp. NPDC050363 TaxID=3155642 RepID=UPI0033E9C19C